MDGRQPPSGNHIGVPSEGGLAVLTGRRCSDRPGDQEFPRQAPEVESPRCWKEETFHQNPCYFDFRSEETVP